MVLGRSQCSCPRGRTSPEVVAQPVLFKLDWETKPCLMTHICDPSTLDVEMRSLESSGSPSTLPMSSKPAWGTQNLISKTHPVRKSHTHAIWEVRISVTEHTVIGPRFT